MLPVGADHRVDQRFEPARAHGAGESRAGEKRRSYPSRDLQRQLRRAHARRAANHTNRTGERRYARRTAADRSTRLQHRRDTVELRDLMRASMNAPYEGYATPLRRLAPLASRIDDPAERDAFLRGEVRGIEVPGSGRRILYDPMRRTAVGISRLGTSEAVAVGAYAFALRQLDRR